MIFRLLIILLVALFAGRPTGAQEMNSERRLLSAVRAQQPPKLDGTLDDPQWSTAASINTFRQREPREGQPATLQTAVKILYDKRALYFAIHCFDDNPDKIVSSELRRDTDFTVDDHFSILISPQNDRRNGYVFTVNPLGTQFDSLIADEGKVNDSNWDGVWRSSAKIVADGWTATIAIPFSTLNFKTSDRVTLGLNFRRFIRRKNEEDLWQSFLRIYGLERVSEGGELSGLQDIGSGRLLVIKPYLLGGVKSNRQTGAAAQHTAGLDLKYGVRSNMVFNLTVNTDFAEAEVDPVRFNLTPFKVLIPEKRQFFLENGGFFQFGSTEGTQLFFSRQIGIDADSGEQVPLDVGAKLTGSAGKYEIGVMDASTRRSGSNPSANYLVARVKRSLFTDSYVGAIAIDKESGNPSDRHNRAFGIDANFRFLKKFNIQGYYAKTFSFNFQMRGRDWTDALSANYESNLVTAQFSHSDIQPNFNPEVGFVDRPDLVSNSAAFELKPRPKSGPFRQFNLIGLYERQTNTGGVLQTQSWQNTLIGIFHNGSYIDIDLFDNSIQRLNGPFNIFRNVIIPGGTYHFDRHQMHYSSNPAKRLQYEAADRFGSFYNGKLNELSMRANYRPNSKVTIAPFFDWNKFNLNRANYNVYLGSMVASYSFNRFLTTSVLAQINSISKNPLSTNFRLRYSYRPDSDLFLIYTIGNQFSSLAGGNPVLTREQRLSVKFTYSWSR
jgi:hypothetical protein